MARPDPLVVTTLRNFRVALGLREDALVESMAGQWLEIESRLDAQIGLLAREMADLVAEGKPITEQLVWRQERYQYLKSQMQTEIAKYNATAVKTISQAQTGNALLGIDAAQAAITTQIGPFGTNWNRINVEAVQNMIGFAGDGSPLKSLLAEDYPDAVDGLLKALINGVARGQSPVQTAREMKDGMAGGLQRALVIARTETARAYRMASTEQYRQSGVVRGFRRLVFRQTACMACLMLDGELFDVASEMDDHPNGKCCAIPMVAGVADPTWETGKQWFAKLTPEEQEAKMGPGMFAAWKDGKIDLSDLAAKQHSDTWGDSPAVPSLASLLGGGRGEVSAPDIEQIVRDSYIDATGKVDTAGIEDMVKQAIAEDQGRATHGNTAANAFYIAGDKVVARNDIASLSVAERAEAISVHSHSAEGWQAVVERTGRVEEFEPLNSRDIHTWLTDVKRGFTGNADAIIMADGRMEIMALTPKVNPLVFKMGEPQLRKLLEPTRLQREAAFAQHVGAARDYDNYALTRTMMRAFARQNGMQYLEGLRWK
jgi:SPP1 gp7 family putative phage head morphogenesis protein